MNTVEQKKEAFERLLTIMDELREKCPWDMKQTLESLRHLSIEEVYELGDAILDGNMEEVKKELGDLFLHLVFFYVFLLFISMRWEPKQLSSCCYFFLIWFIHLN